MTKSTKFSGKKFSCYPLQWDTEYFGVNSARVTLNGIIDEENQNLIMEYCKEYEFITIANVGNSKENNCWIGMKSNAFLTDMNIQFKKKINQEPISIDESTEVINNYHGNEEILDIARSSFNYSRFYNDSNLPQELSENIYLHWTKNAFNNPDKHFVITKRDNKIAGYILFSLDLEEKITTLELIAVDSNFRGQKVGKSLICGLESISYKNDIYDVKVGTQIDNIIATQFYISKEFLYSSCSSVYHLWMDKE